MRFTEQQLRRLEYFLGSLNKDVYPEPLSQGHIDITLKAILRLNELHPIGRATRILDVGCGQAPALTLFQEFGAQLVGVTLSEEDIAACRAKGFTVAKMDQSFLEFDDAFFDIVWGRHVVEHSIFPLFTLHGFSRVLKPGGMLYLEVPAPDTACHHELNKNHYSMLPRSAWSSLLDRAGFAVLEGLAYQFATPAGKDEYWGFYCRKV